MNAAAASTVPPDAGRYIADLTLPDGYRAFKRFSSAAS